MWNAPRLTCNHGTDLDVHGSDERAASAANEHDDVERTKRHE